ncbi:flightin isoform X1 [Schistocerca piceifrons]|uniref:flightin isoform X1 n=2 Tax=Schistocerca piceifrons TaxID=274613 RepID=UPI001F5E41E7|nr:flightin isoform X1 [Schistocerca piceifrons]
MEYACVCSGYSTNIYNAREMSEEEVPAAAAEPGTEPASEPPPMEGGEQPPAPEGTEESKPKYRPSRDPDRPLKFRYWSRPTNLQYKYLYDYRHNYYSDVIDYLDNRSRGIKSDIPRPQTWAERALRTYTNPKKSEALAKRQKDVELLNNIRASNFLYQYHTKDYLYRKYPALTL